jgi:hypothetical protein
MTNDGMPADDAVKEPYKRRQLLRQHSFQEGMAMLWRGLAAGALAAVVFAWTAPARAGDTVKLGLDKSSTPTTTLELKPGDDADTTLAHWHAHYYGGGYHVGHYGYGSFYRGGYASFYHGGFYSPRFYGYGRSFYFPRFYSYSAGFYGPSVSFYSSPSYYYSPPIYYSTPSFCPISLSANVQVPIDPTNVLPPPMTPANPGFGTYPYDGGPANPVPMPRAEPGPTNAPPKAVVPGDERPVSLPAKAGKYNYLAYGEKPGQVEKEETPTFLVRLEPLNKKAPR